MRRRTPRVILGIRVLLGIMMLISLVLFSSATPRVWSQQGGKNRFDQADRNSDGKVTPDELPRTELFSRLDLDGDGEITRPEATRALAGGTLRDLLKSSGIGSSEKSELKRIESIATRTISEDDIKKVTSGPEVLNPNEVGIGRMVPDMAFTDLDAKPHKLSEIAADDGAVLIMTSATCPVSKRYLPEIAKLQIELAKAKLPLILINPFPSEKESAIRDQLAAQPISAVYVHDKDKTIASLLGARTTTEVFLIDRKRTLLYRGALDDQYGINYSLDAPRRRYLLDAVDAYRRGERPHMQATAAPGCELDLRSSSGKQPIAAVTYYGDVARILQQNCVTCHRDDGIAPFSLADLESVEDHASVIKRVVSEETMPPWFAANQSDAESSPWANDCSLSPRDKSDLLTWIDSADRPLGDDRDAPEPKQYPIEWSIGEPDLVLTLSREYDIKATGYMPYQFDVIETQLSEDKWVTAYEILPSARDVVHHVIVKVHEAGSEVGDRGEGAEGYWAVYVPGNGAQIYPQGFARLLPAGSKVSFQIHYTPSGVAKKERLKMGLVFAKAKPQYEVRTVGVANTGISIPAHAAAHVEAKSQPVPFDLPIMGFMPHMHIRGAAFKYEAEYADGAREVLLDIPRYDFNWQLNYAYKEPKLVPRGSTIQITAVYNNSEGNAANPDPGRRVEWGPQTYDEMMIGYIDYFLPLAEEQIAQP